MLYSTQYKTNPTQIRRAYATTTQAITPSSCRGKSFTRTT
ncbi:hypothetical protein VPHK394_0069 [Vibrio phage K394]